MDVDTIAALATPPGIGGVALVRLSGPSALAIAGIVAPGASEPWPVRTPRLVELVGPDGKSVDRGLATYFPGPASYTGEDVVEFSCHGGWLGPNLVVDACVAAGARRAERGEFTRRAYLHGKLDLVQAEAVHDLIEAGSVRARRAALSQLDHGLSSRITDLRQAIVHAEALLSHHIDFPEEDDAPVGIDRVILAAESVESQLDALLATAPEGELLREGVLTVLAGPPNAGKSSIYNALVGASRAIVTDEPGTTRDALESTIQIDGFPFRIVDTAGLRETEARVERMGIEVAERYLDAADMVLFCVPAGEAPSREAVAFLEKVHGTVILLRTKADLLPGDDGGPAMGTLEGSGDHGAREDRGAPEGAAREAREAASIRRDVDIGVSSETGEGFPELKAALVRMGYSALVRADSETPIITRSRHARALERARLELRHFREALESGVPAEMAASHLSPAKTALEEVLGVISVDDILDVVFREFCIGK